MTINRDLADLAQSLVGGIDIADGGTGATTASAARTALSAQTESATLTALASVMSSTATAAAQRAAIGLDTGNTPDFTGITINGGGDALDYFDYGTFTPSATIGLSTPATIASASGFFFRIGKMVLVQGFLSINRGAGETGALQFTNLPFSGTSAGQNFVCMLFANDNVELHDATNGEVQALIRPQQADIYFYGAPTSISAALTGASAQNILRSGYNAGINFWGMYSI